MTLFELIKIAVAGIASSRCYPGEAPPGISGAYLVVPSTFGTRNVSFAGASNLQGERVQLDSWADTVLVAEANAKAVEVAFALQSHLASPTMFTATPLMHEYFGVDPANGKHRVVLEFRLWYYP